MAELIRATRDVSTMAVPVSGSRTPPWDLLLVCVAVYLASSIGRVHQLFPILNLFRPALLATVLAVGLYLLQQAGRRRIGLLRSPTTTCLFGLLVWGGLSVPVALNQGIAFHFWIDFARTVLMLLVIAGSVRGASDLSRLLFVYCGATVLYTGVVLSRFQLGSGDNWRLGHLYYYDANDLATLIATAMPIGLYFVLGQRRLVVRILAGAGLAVLAVGLISSRSRGGLIAILAAATFWLGGFTTIPARGRLVGIGFNLTLRFPAACERHSTPMQT